MALHQYRLCSELLAAGAGNLLQVRANYAHHHSLAVRRRAVHHVRGGRHVADQLPLGEEAYCGFLTAVCPTCSWLGGRALGMGARFREVGVEFPKIGRYIQVYHPTRRGR